MYMQTILLFFFAIQDLTTVSHNPCNISPEEYFDETIDLKGRDIGRPIDQTKKTQKFKAQLWLSENYPLTLQEQVIPIIDLMAASNAHFRKLKDFITLQLPSGFPVKIGKFIWHYMCHLLYIACWCCLTSTLYNFIHHLSSSIQTAQPSLLVLNLVKPYFISSVTHKNYHKLLTDDIECQMFPRTCYMYIHVHVHFYIRWAIFHEF